MPFVRRLARPALAAVFISGGLSAFRHPDARVPEAEGVASKITGTLKRVLPPQYASKIPTDTASLVRINGGVQLAGGLLLAVGRAPRLSSLALAVTLVPTTVARYPFWSRDDATAKADDRTHFVQNIGLLGGLLLASVDTAGKPGLSWRAQRASRDVQRQARHAKGQAKSQAKQARTQAKLARSRVGAAAGSVTDALPFG
jgi:putative oxidoreductase